MPQTSQRAGPGGEGTGPNVQHPTKDTEGRSLSKVTLPVAPGDDPVGEIIDLIVADATPLTPGQRAALRRRILGGDPR